MNALRGCSETYFFIIKLEETYKKYFYKAAFVEKKVVNYKLNFSTDTSFIFEKYMLNTQAYSFKICKKECGRG